MNERTEILTSSFKPVLNIVVYRSENKLSGGDDFYLESHDVNPEGNIMAGKPLKQETLDDIVNVFFDDRKNLSQISGMIPDNLLSFELKPGGHYKMVWYRPAEIRVVHHAAQLKLPSAKCWVPATVYVAERSQLNVYALSSSARPKENTKIWKAPYFNTNDHGNVCLGSAKVQKPKDKTYQNIMNYWESIFWLSEFTHENGQGKVKSKNLISVWKKLLASKTKLKWSDIDEMIVYKDLKLSKLL